MKFGIYRLHEMLEDSDVKAIESEYGIPVNIISVYRAWSSCDIKEDLPWLERLKRASRDLLLTWEPWRVPAGFDRLEDQPEFTLNRILSGQYDDYIRSFLKVLSEFTQTVYLRPMHEMNGNWYPWCGKVNQNTADLFVPAWHYFHNLLPKSVLTNIQWVWSPYATSYPVDPDNEIVRYFPGDEAIDWIAIDGYNWGHTAMGGWQSFEEIFKNAYQTIISISKKPVMIAEFASSEKGGDKAEWVIDAFTSIKKSFQRIKILIWFDENKECDWRMSSSSRTLHAFRKIGKDIFLT